MGAVVAMLGGAAFLLEALAFAAWPGGSAQGALRLAAVLLTAAGLLGVHALQGAAAGWPGRLGLYLALAGSAAQALAAALSLLAGGNYLEGPGLGALFGMGFLAAMLGWALYGVATLRAGVLPPWCGIAFLVLGPQALLPTGEYASVVVAGLIWLALGLALWRRAPEGVVWPKGVV